MPKEIGREMEKVVFDYFGLKAYALFRLTEIFKDETILNINGDDLQDTSGNYVFWGNAINGKIKSGDKIRLLNFQVSSWFPRKPGLFWKKGAQAARNYAMIYHREREDAEGIVLDVHGKNLMTELGGVGCVNFTKERENVLITATSSGDTQEGIPLICHKRVWTTIKKEFDKGDRLALDIDGEVVSLPTDETSFLLTTPGVPKFAVAVESVLNIRKKEGSLNIIVTPWTVFKTKVKKRPYGFTYVTHDLFKDDIQKSTKWLQSYVQDHDGDMILTDFDEELNPLNAVFPLRNVTSGAIANDKMLKFCQQISNDFGNKH